MRIGVPLETRPGETRVAATAETVKKPVAGKHSIVEVPYDQVFETEDVNSEFGDAKK